MNDTKREDFVRLLESLTPGLAAKEILEQSQHFVFKDGWAWTFNGEVCCRRPQPKGFNLTGAVKAEKLLEQLGKWADENVTVACRDGELVVKAGRKRTGVKMDATVALPLEHVEEPTKWKPLPDGFAEAVAVAQQCAGGDQNEFCLTCVHLHPRWVEASDNFQLCRWPLDTKIKKPITVRKDAIRHVAGMGAGEWAETGGQLHFRSNSGLVLSVNRYVEDYPDFSAALEVEGEAVTLPQGLADACDRAAVFSVENAVLNVVTVTLETDKLTVRGEGASGWYSETKKLDDYKGKPIKFCASPVVLADLVKKEQKAVVGGNRLKVTTNDYQYVLNLFLPEDAPAPEPEAKPRKKKARAEVEA